MPNPIERAEAALAQAKARMSVTRLGKLTARETDGDLRALEGACIALNALLAEHKRLLAEMHQRELHHFETEQMLTEAGIDPDAEQSSASTDQDERTAKFREEAERVEKAAWAEIHGQDPTHTYSVAEVKRIVYSFDNLLADVLNRTPTEHPEPPTFTEAVADAPAPEGCAGVGIPEPTSVPTVPLSDLEASWRVGAGYKRRADAAEAKLARIADRIKHEEVDHSVHIDADGEPCGMPTTWKNRLARDVAAILNDDKETDR